ncbi:MAG: hypothetical protein H7323_09405 [Frankiales bacterium]|nr:hypothetical protein [Frankiales bacterium]
MTSSPLDRRSLLRLAALSVVAAGCRGPSGPVDPTASASAGPASPYSSRPSPTPARYAPLAGEMLPHLKQTAADFVQTMVTRSPGQRPEDVLRVATSLLAPEFQADAALRVAAPLFAEQSSAGQIVFPQLSGLSPLGPDATSAGVMVVVRQRLTSKNGRSKDVVRVLDVRLRVEQGVWRVVALVTAGGGPVDRPRDLAPGIAAVLDDPRIELPDTCRWDVHAGRVSPDLIAVLATAAKVAPVAVTVMRTGHPQNVFGTAKLSNHSQGRAVDLWRVGGQPVVSTGAVTGSAHDALLAASSDPRTRQTGSPPGSDLDGPKTRSFTDLVHQDHLHLAVGATTVGG